MPPPDACGPAVAELSEIVSLLMWMVPKLLAMPPPAPFAVSWLCEMVL